MRFLKKRTDYFVMYSKKEAVKLLKADERVKNIRVTSQKMYINTYPITPIVTNKRYKRTFLCPIGTYKITITNHRYDISCIIRRIKSIGRMHHYHIQENWDQGGICWGSAMSEVGTIKCNKDWFWLAKQCLNLLEDGNPEYGEFLKWYNNTYDLMIDYAKSKKDKKLAKKLETIQKRKLKNYRER